MEWPLFSLLFFCLVEKQFCGSSKGSSIFSVEMPYASVKYSCVISPLLITCPKFLGISLSWHNFKKTLPPHSPGSNCRPLSFLVKMLKIACSINTKLWFTVFLYDSHIWHQAIECKLSLVCFFLACHLPPVQSVWIILPNLLSFPDARICLRNIQFIAILMGAWQGTI